MAVDPQILKRETAAAGFHAQLKQAAHLGQFRWRGTTVLGRFRAHDIHEQRDQRHIGQHVDALGGALETLHEFGECFPVPRKSRLHGLERHRLVAGHGEHRALAVFGLARGEAEAAIADGDRSDAVPAGNRAPRIPEQLGIVMRVQIDETRRDDQPAGVKDLPRIAIQPADLRDFPVADADVADKPTASEAIDDRAAANDRVKSAHHLSPWGSSERQFRRHHRWPRYGPSSPARLRPRCRGPLHSTICPHQHSTARQRH